MLSKRIANAASEEIKRLRERMQEYQRLEYVFSPSNPLYARWFGGPADLEPLEAVQGSHRAFHGDEVLTDLAQWHRAAGVSLDPGGVGRSDHLAAELEFMAVLISKELKACLKRNEERAARFRKMQTQFFNRHLGQWAPVFAEGFAKRFPEGCSARLAERLREFLQEETRELNLSFG